jgi:hypothetical protein
VAMGQAAGTAAALAVQTGVLPSQIPVDELIALLKADGVKL